MTLKYYEPEETSCPLYSDMLASESGNGQCTAFARLFAEILKAQGIADHNSGLKFAQVIMNGSYDIEFFVKDVGLNNPSRTDGCAGGTHHIDDVVDNEGIAAQGTPNPDAKRFLTHVLVSYNGVFYDPSYGKRFLSSADFEDNAIDLFVVRCFTLSTGLNIL